MKLMKYVLLLLRKISLVGKFYRKKLSIVFIMMIDVDIMIGLLMWNVIYVSDVNIMKLIIDVSLLKLLMMLIVFVSVVIVSMVMNVEMVMQLSRKLSGGMLMCVIVMCISQNVSVVVFIVQSSCVCGDMCLVRFLMRLDRNVGSLQVMILRMLLEIVGQCWNSISVVMMILVRILMLFICGIGCIWNFCMLVRLLLIENFL